MSVLKEAAELLRGWEITDTFRDYADGGYMWDGTYSGSIYELDNDTLVSAFSYQVELDPAKIDDESKVPLGTSKHRGLPHLPRDMAWPDQMFFDTQINLAELAEVDVSGRLPKSGMLYFFQSNRHGTHVEYWDGDVGELAVREYPDAAELDDAEYYLRDFLAASATLRLKPFWLIYINDGDATDYRGLRGALPNDLVEGISGIVGAGLAGWDQSFRLYGRPQYWQGEDEGEMPIGFDEEGQPIWAPPVEKLLLLQTDLGDAAIHFWCNPDAAARGDFSGAWSGFSGT